ncbi:hypothetical protein FKM82_019685 [Ascaphus truei]
MWYLLDVLAVKQFQLEPLHGHLLVFVCLWRWRRHHHHHHHQNPLHHVLQINVHIIKWHVNLCCVTM